jgi:membrane protein DedA with SNARE-associated domain
MTIESSFIPFPSEIIIIPAGYLAYQGDLNLTLVIIVGIIGSIFGALINYFIGKKLGRKYILKHQKLFFINKKHLINSELFFKRYGGITTFIARLIPVVRQYISLPAGFSNMNLSRFILWTSLGVSIWVIFLAFLGFFIGNSLSMEVISIYNWIILSVLGISIIIVTFIYFKKRK